jgi:hypothetical protein
LTVSARRLSVDAIASLQSIYGDAGLTGLMIALQATGQFMIQFDDGDEQQIRLPDPDVRRVRLPI